MKTVKVVCGIIWKDGKIFIARRKPEKSMGGYWEFPGGKIEQGEDPKEALARELKEELGMEVKVLNHFGSNLHQYESFSIELIAYICEFVNATFELTDHVEWKFITHVELSQYKLAPADLPFVERIQMRLENEILRITVKELKAQLALHLENYASAAADLFIHPNPVKVHGTLAGKGMDFMVSLMNVLLVESARRGKNIYLREAIIPEEGGKKYSKIISDGKKLNFEKMLYSIQKNSHHLIRVNRSIALNIYHYNLSNEGTFVLNIPVPEGLNESFVKIKTDKTFDKALYHTRLMEIDRLSKHHKDFAINLKKLEEISRYSNEPLVTFPPK